ncbi:hypothetical protein H257_02927 [Aphanomyces astaci]|uniref:Uncharacterized protein n=1 Tax=Aphanomyces astaci TaxID=112090 RepID=W4GZB5_APHAT|nr:hypothetical protein H257_02927 [Aphanomyces astaci]ETV85050.1 hypothetical protein H257_02927 [Aphanomyces astaci]|eukprot:XP_009825068.1 hypothetical protein H257_02927 [Aphanomyces astaci]
MTANLLLTQPFHRVTVMLRRLLGPFGYIDARYVPCPDSLKVVMARMTEAIVERLADNDEHPVFMSSWQTRQSPWIGLSRISGNLLCPTARRSQARSPSSRCGEIAVAAASPTRSTPRGCPTGCPTSLRPSFLQTARTHQLCVKTSTRRRPCACPSCRRRGRSRPRSCPRTLSPPNGSWLGVLRLPPTWVTSGSFSPSVRRGTCSRACCSLTTRFRSFCGGSPTTGDLSAGGGVV